MDRIKFILVALLAFVACGATFQTSGNYYPPTTISGLSAYVSPSPGTSVWLTNGSPVAGATPGPTGSGGQVVWTGSAWNYVAGTNTSSITPFSTSANCNSTSPANGGCTFVSGSHGTLVFGAGGTALPTLTSPVTVNCLNNSGDEALLAAQNGKNILITGSQCDITSTWHMASNTVAMCQNSSTVLFDPALYTAANGLGGANVDTGQSMISVAGSSNVGIYNCTLSGTNATNPPNFISSGTVASSLVAGGWSAGASNITIEDDLIEKCVGQGCVQFLGTSGSATYNNNIVINYDSFQWCGIYGSVLDGATGSANNQYSFDCRAGGDEMDSGRLINITWGNNYITRDNWGCANVGSQAGDCNLAFCVINDSGGGPNGTCGDGPNYVNNNNEPAYGNVETFQTNAGATITNNGTDYCWNGCSCDGYGANCSATAP